jgi:hypothetical protein
MHDSREALNDFFGMFQHEQLLSLWSEEWWAGTARHGAGWAGGFLCPCLEGCTGTSALSQAISYNGFGNNDS